MPTNRLDAELRIEARESNTRKYEAPDYHLASHSHAAAAEAAAFACVFQLPFNAFVMSELEQAGNAGGKPISLTFRTTSVRLSESSETTIPSQSVERFHGTGASACLSRRAMLIAD